MNNDPYAHNELLETLTERQAALVAHAAQLPEAFFLSGSSEKWGPAHHLLHLVITYDRIGYACTIPEKLPDYNAPARRYAAVQALYQASLAAVPPGALTNTPLTPQLETSATQDAVLEQYRQAGQRFLERIQTWADPDLDVKGMKHPLMGIVSVREMLMFCAYHDTHHLEGIRRMQP
jgi:hypothetical protein